MTMRSGQRPEPGGLWLLLVPLACCGGPLLAAGLAAAGVLAWGGLGLALTAVATGAMLVIWRRRRACAVGAMSQEPEKSEPAVPGFRRDGHQENAAGCRHGQPSPAGAGGDRRGGG